MIFLQMQKALSDILCTTKYDGLINSLQECYDTVRSNRSELEVPSDDGYYDENGQGDLR